MVAHWFLALWLGEDGDPRSVGGDDNGFGIEEKGASGLDGEAGGSSGAHGLDGADADDGDVVAHVLIWLGDFDDCEVAAKGGFAGDFAFAEGAEECAGSLDGSVGAFHGLDGDAGLCGDNDGLTKVVGGDGTGDGAAVDDVLALVFVGGAA